MEHIMRWNNLTKQDQTLFVLIPILYSFFMGATVGVYSNRPFPSIELRMLYWVGQMLIAVLIYVIVALLGKPMIKRPYRFHFKDHWPYAFITFLLLYILHIGRVVTLKNGNLLTADSNFQSITLMTHLQYGDALLYLAVQIVTMVLCSEAILQFTGFTRILVRLTTADKQGTHLQPRRIEPDAAPRAKKPSILIGKGIHQQAIEIDSISHIIVENHFSTITYRARPQWKEAGEYRSLSEIERECPHFYRINRSTLINPAHVKAVTKSGRQFRVHMDSEPEATLLISRAKSHLKKYILDGIQAS